MEFHCFQDGCGGWEDQCEDHIAIWEAATIRTSRQDRDKARPIGALRHLIAEEAQRRARERLNVQDRVQRNGHDWLRQEDNFDFNRLLQELTDFEDGALRALVTAYMNNFLAYVRFNNRGMYIERYFLDGEYTYTVRKRADMLNRFVPYELRWKVPDPRRADHDKDMCMTVFEIWEKHVDRREFDNIVFEPAKPVPQTVLNIWTGRQVSAEQCAEYAGHTYTDSTNRVWTVDDVFNHIYTFWAARNKECYEYIVKWLAWCVQRPGQRLCTALIMVSDEGTGKDILTYPLFKLLYGQNFMHTSKIDDIAGKFADVEGRVVIVGDEIDHINQDIAACLKSFVTDPTVRIEKKNQQVYFVSNHANVLLFTNNPNKSIQKVGPNQRRYVTNP